VEVHWGTVRALRCSDAPECTSVAPALLRHSPPSLGKPVSVHFAGRGIEQDGTSVIDTLWSLYGL